MVKEIKIAITHEVLRKIESRNLKDEKKPCAVLTNIEIKRVIVCIKGKVIGEVTKTILFALCKKDSDYKIPITNITWSGDSFEFEFHLMNVDNGDMLKNGKWFVNAFKDGSYCNCYLDENMKSTLEEQKIHHVEKENEEYYNVSSKVDDNGEYFIEVDWKKVEKKITLKERVYRKLGRYSFVMLFNIFKHFNNKKGNKVLFASWSRDSLSGNHEFVYKKMLERGLDKKFKISLFYCDSLKHHKVILDLKKLQLAIKMALSDFIIVDNYFGEISWLDLPKHVKVLQLWHGGGNFKLVGYQLIEKHHNIGIGTKLHKGYSAIPVTNELSAKCFAEAFAVSEDSCVPIGLPRMDMFFDEKLKEEKKLEMFEKFPQCKNTKEVIMYAPTYRRDGKKIYFPFEVIDFERVGEYLIKNKGVLFIKMHPIVREKLTIPEKYRNVIFDVSEYREINDFFFITDVLITDYSSSIYDFSLLNKPMIFFAFDREDYEKQFGFYEPYEDIVAGKIVSTFEDVVKCLENKDFEIEKLKGFVKKNFKYTDGKSSDRVIDTFILKENTNKKILK